jgi:nucleoside-diphosphate-sugar epimerase
MERLINVFGGSGFVGSRYVSLTANYFSPIAMPNIIPNVLVNDREDYEIKNNVTDVVYFISTIDNYNVHTDLHIDIDTNLTTLMYVLESLKGKGDVTFNFISSWFVYGDVPLPAKEDARCDPKGFYSITKRTAEQLIISFCETFNIKYRILRLANVLGPTDHKVSKKKNALQYMINEIKEGRDVDLYDGGTPFRDYIYVDDAVKAINLVIEKGAVNEIYNIGNGKKVVIKDVLEAVRIKTRSKSKFNNIPPAEFHNKVQTKDMVLDISKIESLGYKTEFTMDKVLNSLLYPTN